MAKYLVSSEFIGVHCENTHYNIDTKLLIWEWPPTLPERTRTTGSLLSLPFLMALFLLHTLLESMRQSGESWLNHRLLPDEQKLSCCSPFSEGIPAYTCSLPCLPVNEFWIPSSLLLVVIIKVKCVTKYSRSPEHKRIISFCLSLIEYWLKSYTNAMPFSYFSLHI